MFIATAGAVGIDITFLLVPLVLVPLVVAIVVFIAGREPKVLAGSALAATAYAALGMWNFYRAAAFEEANPGSTEVSGGEVSIAFTLLAAMTAFWSLVAAYLARRRRRAD